MDLATAFSLYTTGCLFWGFFVIVVAFSSVSNIKERVLDYTNQENVLMKVVLLFCVNRQPVQKQEKRKEVERFSKTCMFSLWILLNHFESKRRAKLVDKENGNWIEETWVS